MTHKPISSAHHFSSIIDILRYRAMDQPDREAYTFLTGGETESSHLITYGELDRLAHTLGALLQQKNLSGERVLLLYQPGVDYIVAFFGCLYAGAIAVPAYPPQSQRLMQRLHAILENVQARALLTTTFLYESMRSRSAQLPILHQLPHIMTDTLTVEGEPGLQRFQATEKTLAFLQYTSGSTARPKGVMLTHGNLLHNLAFIQQRFQQSPASRGVIWLPPYHDMGLIGGILQPLYTGFPVTLLPPMAFLQHPLKWLQTISNTGATGSGGPNFAYDLCVSKITPEQRTQLDLSTWELAFCGAEPIHHETLKRFATTFAECGFRREAFYPCYGLAEATLMVTGGSVFLPPVLKAFRRGEDEQKKALTLYESERMLVGCGQSGPGQQVIIVHPDTRCCCIDNQVGEIWVSGLSVAQGYWNDPEETRYTFQAYLADTGEGPFLRTGDLGFIHDGELFIIGRLKNMLILRGLNYYAEDIEQTIEHSLPETQTGRCAAFAIEARDEERLVIALEVGRHAARSQDLEALTQAVQRVISEQYALQVYAVVLLKPNSIPRTSSGKLQRAACRERFLAGTLSSIVNKVFDPLEVASNAAPRDLSLAQLLAASPAHRQPLLVSYLQRLVAHFLRTSASDIDGQSPLHALGLDSLMIMEIKNLIEAQFVVSLPLSVFFDEGSIHHLAADILSQQNVRTVSSRKEIPAIPPGTNEFPLSFGQRALWFLQQMNPHHFAYNIACAIQVQNELNRATLQEALQMLFNRHAVLKTVYLSIHGKPVQRIIEQMQVTIEQRELPDQRLSDWQARLQNEIQQPFDLEHGPLLRVSLWSLSAQEHILLCVAHHIAVDFRSLVMFAQELIQLYQTPQSSWSVSFPALSSTYGAYVNWQDEMLKSTRGDQAWKYWQKQLDGAQFVLDLPGDWPRPQIPSSRGASHLFTLSRELSLQLKQLIQTEGTTLYMLLLAAFQTLLYRYTAQEDIVVGSPASGRPAAEFEDIIGYFVNPIVLRAKMSLSLSFRSLLQQVRQTVLEGLEYQDYPFPLLVERLQPMRNYRRSPIFQVMFTLYRSHTLNQIAERFLVNAEEWIDLEGLHVRPFALDQQTAQFDLALSMVDIQGHLSGTFQYNIDLFAEATIQRLARHWQILLEGIVAQPDALLGTLPLLPEEEARYVLHTVNQTHRPLPPGQTLPGLLAEQAARQPDALAVLSDHHALTYGALDQRANQLAHHLQALHVRPEQRVGLALDRSSPDLVIALLAILKVGAAYVPLDVSYPAERLAFLCADAALAAIITRQDLLPHLPAPVGSPLLCLDELSGLLDRYPATPPAGQTFEDQLAYVIYTSGSTGTPKGVGCTHRNVLNTLAEFQRRWEVVPGLRWSLWTSINFDVSVYEIFLPLLTGGSLTLIPETLRADGPACFAWLQDRQIQAGYLPPFLLRPLQQWLSQQMSSLPSLALRYLLVGVEPIPEDLLLDLMRRLPALHIFNAYGPTESTICATVYEPGPPVAMSRTTPLGRPMQNVDLYVLDTTLQPVPLGVVGELYLGGAGLARGYLGRPDLTAERFLPHPWSSLPGQRLYKTGDLVRWLPEGVLLFLGRNDQQIKVHGFRVEPGEIEAALARYPQVRASAVLLREHPDGEQRLVAYVVADQLSVEDLRTFLRQQLPTYMHPGAIVCLERLPLLPNGKLDRAALPTPADWESVQSGRGLVAPRNPVEALLVRIWGEILHLKEVGIEDNFFALGGHSLLAMQLLAHIRENFQVEIPVQVIFDQPTIASLATVIEQYTATQRSAPARPALTPVPRASHRVKLSSIRKNAAETFIRE